MKKIIRVAALGGAVALALAACGSAPDETAETPSGEGSAAAAADFTGCMVSDFGGFDDNSFNQSGLAGLERAESELGIDGKTAESTDAGQYNTNIDSMVQAGCNLIITVGFNLADATAAAARTRASRRSSAGPAAPDPGSRVRRATATA